MGQEENQLLQNVLWLPHVHRGRHPPRTNKQTRLERTHLYHTFKSHSVISSTEIPWSIHLIIMSVFVRQGWRSDTQLWESYIGKGSIRENIRSPTQSVRGSQLRIEMETLLLVWVPQRADSQSSMAALCKTLCRGQEFWERKVWHFIKGTIILPVSLAWLKVNPLFRGVMPTSDGWCIQLEHQSQCRPEILVCWPEGISP